MSEVDLQKAGYYFMLRCKRQEAQDFKQWCKSQGLTMSLAMRMLMRRMVKKNYKIKQSLYCEAK